jgi:hypothetical protein
MTTAPQTRRRVFQFGLRTMFVAVTVFAVWLGDELKFVRDRQTWIRENEYERERLGQGVVTIHWLTPAAPIPFWRRWLGDRSVRSVELFANATNADLDRAKYLFPEASVSPPN